MKTGSKTSRFGTSSRITHDSSAYYGSRLYDGMVGEEVQSLPANPYPEELLDKNILSSSEAMSGIPDRSVHLMITSPPYNVTKEYDENMSLPQYLAFLRRVFKETYRVLVDGGRGCVNVANLGRKPYIPLSGYINLMMGEIGFRQRGEIIWNKGAGAGVNMAWGSWMSASNPVLRDVHEYILVFSKGDFRRAGKGKGKSTIKREQFMEWTKSVWTMNPESARKVKHPAPFPVELPYRLIQLYSFEGDIVLDPFIGSGTTAIAALKAGRHYVGYDTNPEYVTIADKRIERYKQEIATSRSEEVSETG